LGCTTGEFLFCRISPRVALLQAIIGGFGIAVGKLYRGDSFKKTKRWKMFIYLNFQHFPLHKTYDEKNIELKWGKKLFLSTGITYKNRGVNNILSPVSSVNYK
jgi:hypothetical protein